MCVCVCDVAAAIYFSFILFRCVSTKKNYTQIFTLSVGSEKMNTKILMEIMLDFYVYVRDIKGRM